MGDVAVPDPERAVSALQLLPNGNVAASTTPDSSQIAVTFPPESTPSRGEETVPEPDKVVGELQDIPAGSELALTEVPSTQTAVAFPLPSITTRGSDAVTPIVDMLTGLDQVNSAATSIQETEHNAKSQIKKNFIFTLRFETKG